MSWQTNRVVIWLRTLGRAVGINRAIGMLLRSGRDEERFHRALLENIKAGDCVWDIGANVGMYSTLFSERVGVDGRVIAFEPSPINRDKLIDAINGFENVLVFPYALGERNSKVLIRQGNDPLGATTRIVEAGRDFGLEVELATGDSLIADRGVPVPAVLKIDTEGFEFDVLNGLKTTLQSEIVRAVCIEVHFEILKLRGMPNAPAEMEELLKFHGFRCKWVDASHIVALRMDCEATH